MGFYAELSKNYSPHVGQLSLIEIVGYAIFYLFVTIAFIYLAFDQPRGSDETLIKKLKSENIK